MCQKSFKFIQKWSVTKGRCHHANKEMMQMHFGMFILKDFSLPYSCIFYYDIEISEEGGKSFLKVFCYFFSSSWLQIGIRPSKIYNHSQVRNKCKL